MSVYGYLCCTNCKEYIWLGKAINWTEDAIGPKSFARGDAPDGCNWKMIRLNQALWKFLAEHTARDICVVLEHEFEKLLRQSKYQEIGDAEDGGVSF